MASATIKYFEDNGRVADDLPHARWAIEDSLAEIDKAFGEFIRNFPVRAVAAILRGVVFPFGRNAVKGPDDRLNAEVAEMLMTKNAFAERLREKVYIGSAESDPTGRILATFEKLVSIEPGYTNFLKAVSSGKVVGEGLESQLVDAVNKGVVTAEIAQGIREYEPLRFDAIQVDSFSKDYLRTNGAIPDEVFVTQPVSTFKDAA
jgi:hypothetical protein